MKVNNSNKSWHPRIVGAVDSLGLREFHTDSAEIAVHSRPAGVTQGILVGAKKAPPGQVRLNYQEVDDYRLLLFALGRYVRLHAQLLQEVRRIYPELEETHLREVAPERCHAFTQTLAERVFQVRQAMGPYGLRDLLSGKPLA